MQSHKPAYPFGLAINGWFFRVPITAEKNYKSASVSVHGAARHAGYEIDVESSDDAIFVSTRNNGELASQERVLQMIYAARNILRPTRADAALMQGIFWPSVEIKDQKIIKIYLDATAVLETTTGGRYWCKLGITHWTEGTPDHVAGMIPVEPENQRYMK